MADNTTEPTVMTKELCLQKFDERLPRVMAEMKEKARAYLNSGAINVEDYPPNFILPNILLSAVANDMAFAYRPNDPEAGRVINNLAHF